MVQVWLVQHLKLLRNGAKRKNLTLMRKVKNIDTKQSTSLDREM